MNEDQSYQTTGFIPDPYSIFCYKNRDMMIANNPNSTIYEINAKLSEMWNNMSENERMNYREVQDVHGSNKVQQYQGFNPVQPIPEMNSQQNAWPNDPQKYLIWLGTQVVQQWGNPNPQLGIDMGIAQKPFAETSEIGKLVQKIKYSAINKV